MRCSQRTRVKIENQSGQKGRQFTIHYIEPGVVQYEDIGIVMVDKPTLDKMAATFIGKPVFGKTHKDTTANDFSQGKADGIVTDCFWDGDKGKYAVRALIWDDDTISDIGRRNYLPSCAYDVRRWRGSDGKHNNVPYVDEVLDGEYTHMAIVPNPRYERVSIIANQGGHMIGKFWPFKKDVKPEDVQPSEVELANSVIELEPGKEVKIDDVIAGYRADQKRREELANAKPKFGDDDSIEVDGKKVLVKDLKAGYQSHLANEMKASMETDHKDGKHKEKHLESCEMCNSERKNAEEEEKRKKDEEEKEEKERKNALDAKKAEEERRNFERMKNAKDKGQEPKMPEAPADIDSRLAAGAERYGATN